MHVDVTTRFGGKGEGDGGREEGFDFVYWRTFEKEFKEGSAEKIFDPPLICPESSCNI